MGSMYWKKKLKNKKMGCLLKSLLWILKGCEEFCVCGCKSQGLVCVQCCGQLRAAQALNSAMRTCTFCFLLSIAPFPAVPEKQGWSGGVFGELRGSLELWGNDDERGQVPAAPKCELLVEGLELSLPSSGSEVLSWWVTGRNLGARLGLSLQTNCGSAAR